MYSFLKFFAERHILANLIIFMTIILGIFTLTRIRREIFPDVDFGMMTVTTVYPGASPEDVVFPDALHPTVLTISITIHKNSASFFDNMFPPPNIFSFSKHLIIQIPLNADRIFRIFQFVNNSSIGSFELRCVFHKTSDHNL